VTLRFLFLWLVSFLVGAGVMVVEITGARLLAPTCGVSPVPWTGVIAAVLAGVALGNAWGGRRSARGTRALPGLLVAAALFALLPLFRADLPDRLFDLLGLPLGVVTTSLLLFFPAAFLLGAAAPLLVQLGTRRLDEVGRKTGLLNGANALGAIGGTLATGFVLIPLLPISWILAVAGGLLGALGLATRFVSPEAGG
jgi:predicted membrane-bound spermidine synthase